MANRRSYHPDPDSDELQLETQKHDDLKEEELRKFQDYVRDNFPTETPEIKQMRHKFWLAWGMIFTFFTLVSKLMMNLYNISPKIGVPIVALPIILISIFLSPYYAKRL